MAKYVIASVVAAIALFGAIHGADLILGNYLPGDRILHSQVYLAPGVYNRTASQTVTYNGIYNITAVRAFDRSMNRSGLVSLVSGGIGQRSVQLLLQGNKIGVGFDYLVEIYGR